MESYPNFISGNTRIDEIELSNRVRNVLLRQEKLHTVSDLLEAFIDGRLNNLDGFGRKGFEEVQKVLKNAYVGHTDDSPHHTNHPDGMSAWHEQINLKWLGTTILGQVEAQLLHPEAVFEGRPIADWIKEVQQGSLSTWDVYTTLAVHISRVTNVSQELSQLLINIPIRSVSFYVLRFGSKEHTLQEVGDQAGLTRERVRQLEVKVERQLLKQLIRLTPLRMHSAFLFARDMGWDTLNLEEWRNKITKSGLLGFWGNNTPYNSIDPLEMMIAVSRGINRDYQCAQLTMPDNLHFLLSGDADPENALRAAFPKDINKLIRRHRQHAGAVHLHWIAGKASIDPQRLRNVLKLAGFEETGKNWLIAPPPKDLYSGSPQYVFYNAVRKMLAICGALTVEDICGGLRQVVSHRNFPVPNPRIMEVILAKYGFNTRDGKYYFDGVWDQPLSNAEQIILSCIEQQGPVVHHQELAMAFLNSHLSFPSLHMALRRSPVFKKLSKGLWTIRGYNVQAQDVERAQAIGSRIQANLEVTYDRQGGLLLSITLGPLTLVTGVFSSDHLPNLEGPPWTYTFEQKACGELQVTKREIRHLRRIFDDTPCSVGDRIRLRFDMFSRTVTCQKLGADR